MLINSYMYTIQCNKMQCIQYNTIQYNAFKLYKNKFFDIVIPRKKRNLRSNRILRILNKRELKTLQEYWMIIGVSLPLYVNVGIQVKKNRVKSFEIEHMHLNNSTVIVSGQNTIAIYL